VASNSPWPTDHPTAALAADTSNNPRSTTSETTTTGERKNPRKQPGRVSGGWAGGVCLVEVGLVLAGEGVVGCVA